MQSPNKSLVQELRLLLGYVTRQRQRQFGLLLILMVVSSLSEVISLGALLPFLLALSNAGQILTTPHWQPLLALFDIETPTQLVMGFALVFIAAVIGSNALRILTINVQTHLAASISSDLSCQLYKKTLLQPYRFYLKHNSSDLINTVMEDTRQLTINILIPLMLIIANTFVILTLGIGLFLIDGRVAVIAAVTLGSAYACLYRLRRNLLQRNSQVTVESSQQQIKVVQEGLGGIRDVLLRGAQQYFQTAYQTADMPYRHAVALNAVISLTPRYLIEGMAMAAIGLLALILGRNGDFSRVVPVLGSLALGANRLLPALQHSFAALAKIQGTRVSLQRILCGLKRTVDPVQMWLPDVELTLKEELRLKNVWFRYSDEIDWVLKDINLRIKANTTVGFVGSTGSGKSTMADLVLGLLQPQKGTILVDGQSLQGERLRQWQHGIAHVPQNIFLIDATIAENIAFGIPKETIDFQKVYRAAHLAQIDEFIRGLPAQYETYVGERGVRLSGGQRQRIGIARAMYQKASVIVFDEATSALDNTTEKEVMAAINKLSGKFTIILIAHRLSTVEKCDQLVELGRGNVVCSGTFEELLTHSPSFKALTKTS